MRYFLRCLFMVAFCILLMVSAQPADAASANWNMLGYSSSHKRVNPHETVLSKSTVSKLTLDWTVITGGVIESLDTIVSNGVAYFTSQDGKLYAVNAATGAILWSESLNPDEYQGGFDYSSPAVGNGVLYICSASGTNGNMYALNAKTGAVVWVNSSINASCRSSVTIVHETLFIGGAQNVVYGLNAATGALLWSTTLSTIPNEIQSSPAVVNGVVYVVINGATTASLYALNSSTGATLWGTPLGAQVSDSSPAVADGLVFVGAGDGLIYAFNATSGKLKWTSSSVGNVIASPAVFEKIVYIGGNGTSNHKVFALNERTGAVIWTASTNNNVIASATVANGVVYDASVDGSVYAFDALTAATLWTGTAGSCPSGNNCTLSSPVVCNGVLYIGGSDSKMYTFHLEN